MDRRKEDRGWYVRIKFETGEQMPERRSRQDRRKHDLLAEASLLLEDAAYCEPVDENHKGLHHYTQELQILRILITMMERRK